MSGLRLHRPTSLSDFLELSAPFLEKREAQHGLLLGIAASVTNPPRNGYWGLVLNDGEVVCAAVRLTDRLILSCEDAVGSIALLTADAYHRELSAVAGPPESVESFVRASGVAWRTRRMGRIYECRSVLPAPPVPGVRRALAREHRDVFVQWAADIAMASGVILSRGDAEAAFDRHIDNGSLYIWAVDGRPVSQAAAVGPTRNGIRINDVYTPAEMRGRGYAGALVGSITHHLLDAGRSFTFLHTDLANPSSQALYQRIGYVPVGSEQVSWRMR